LLQFRFDLGHILHGSLPKMIPPRLTETEALGARVETYFRLW